MLSCHPDPFAAFIKDLQLPGCEVHLYRGPNTFGMTIDEADSPQNAAWWEKENIYFLPGVKSGIRKRAADLDIEKRHMFTLDFDIRNELDKAGKDIWSDTVEEMADRILCSIENHPLFGNFRYAVLSGNGMHVHYFGEPCSVNKEQWAAGMKDLFMEVNRMTPLPCDMGVGNAGRIMRMPGSWNVKSEPRKPVEFLAWMPQSTFGNMQMIQDRGAHVLRELTARKTAQQREFQEMGTASDTIALINSIPIEQVVNQLLNCTPKQKRDGGMRFVDEHGKERGFFKHHVFNIIVHEGTSLFDPPADKGYNCLGLVKAVLRIDTPHAIQWFAEKSPRVAEVEERSRGEWIKEHQSHELELVEQSFQHFKL